MRIYRQKWDRFASQLWGTAPTEAVQAAGISRSLVVWLLTVVALMGVTWLLTRFGTSLAWLIGAMWGFSVGASLLIFFTDKWVTTIVGGLAGAGLSNLQGITGIADALEKQNEAVRRIAVVVNEALSLKEPISTLPVWLFLGFLFFTCLFAYWTNDETT
jgi:hypothetical protein